MATREEIVRAAGDLAAEQDLAEMEMSPHELAEAAWTPGCGYTVAQLEAEIREERGLPQHNDATHPAAS